VTTAAVLVAAGRGERLGVGGPKALLPLAGRTLLEHALDGLRGAGVRRLVVVHPAGVGETAAQLAPDATLAIGGDTRTASVRAGLAAVDDDVEVVAVHDAARPLMPVEVIREALAAVTGDVVAAAPARPVPDTLKRVVDGDVVGTVDRHDLVAVQTPQVFRRVVLDAALARDREATDDLALVEALLADGGAHGRIVTVPGSALGLKITWPEDLELAEALCRAPAGAAAAERSEGRGRRSRKQT
jgi:2-C-methyl-D-erythritol 4-phosphate cytidylyltransferase